MSEKICKICNKEMLDNQDCKPMSGLDDVSDHKWWIHKSCEDEYPYNHLTHIASHQYDESLIGAKVYVRHSLSGLTPILLLGDKIFPPQYSMKKESKFETYARHSMENV